MLFTIFFSCPVCGLVHAKGKVRFREQNEQMLHWIEDVKESMWLYHRLLSPMCPNSNLQLILPTTDRAGIGQREPNHWVMVC